MGGSSSLLVVSDSEDEVNETALRGPFDVVPVAVMVVFGKVDEREDGSEVVLTDPFVADETEV